MKKTKYFKTIFLLIIILGFFVVLNSVNATETLLSDSSTPCIEDGSCGLNDMVQVAIRATDILLGLTGSVALLMFIYGGVVFLISGGSPEKVSQGKQIITNSVIGILLIFSSYLIIQFSMTALGYDQDGIFGKWYQSK